jgi:hypothetical protein
VRKLLSLTLIIIIGIPGISFAKSAKEALKELKKIEARTETGISYRDYPKVLADAKVEVNEFLESKEAKKKPQLAEHIKKALDYYLIAGDIWNIKFMRGRPNDIIPTNSSEGKIIYKLYPKAKSHLPKAPSGVRTTPGLERFISQSGPDYYIPEVLNDIWGDASKEIKKAANYFD